METARRKARLIHNQSQKIPVEYMKDMRNEDKQDIKQEKPHKAGRTLYLVLSWTPRWMASGALRPVLKYSAKQYSKVTVRETKDNELFN